MGHRGVGNTLGGGECIGRSIHTKMHHPGLILDSAEIGAPPTQYIKLRKGYLLHCSLGHIIRRLRFLQKLQNLSQALLLRLPRHVR